jgi:FAD/FMN-containing dehydrogenase
MLYETKDSVILGRDKSNGHKRISISHLRASLKGTVIVPSDAAYDEARTVFAGDIDRRPAIIVRVADEDDVIHVVSLARERGLELAVRSGGHSSAGHSLSEGGIVLDLRDMKALHIDPESRTAWAETGLTSGEYTAAAGAYGLATGFGDTGSVGIGGITLGGGIGFLVRKHGLTIDNLLAADIVTADGQLLRVDADNNPGLFWAIRGGGGNFGVVRWWAGCLSCRLRPKPSPGSSPRQKPHRKSYRPSPTSCPLRRCRSCRQMCTARWW